MDEQRRIRVSKYLSFVLRHRPDKLGLTLAPGGWVPVDVLLAAMAHDQFAVSEAELAEVVAWNPKQRFAFDESGTRIRANQGHSFAIDLQLEPVTPPALLYHGTTAAVVDAILREGLHKMQRHHVHLSPDVETAQIVGQRRGQPVILCVDSAAMHAAGITFHCSANGVWLVDHVPPAYLALLSSRTE